MNHSCFSFYFDDERTPDTDTQSATLQPHDDVTPLTSDKKYTDEDLDRIIGDRFKRWQTQQQRAIDEAKRLAEMSAQERAEAERDLLQKELDELKQANARAEMERIARKMLIDDGVIIGDEVVGMLVRSDADSTRSAVRAFSESYKASVQQGVSAALSHKAPSGAFTSNTPTKDEIMKIKDPIKRQQAIKANMKLFR